jgi:hypothetical protein
MQALRSITNVDENGFIKMSVPPKFGRKVEVIILPVPYKQYESESFSRISACKDDDTVAEDILDV